MKGQYLAIETVLTFAMGISLATGSIAVFNSYQSDMLDTTTEKEVDIVNSEIKNALFNLKGSDSGFKEIDLPEDVGGSEYSIAVDNQIRLNVNLDTYRNKLNLGEEYSFRGSVDGGEITIYKSGNEFILREG